MYNGIYRYVHTKVLQACEDDYIHINSFKNTNLI